MKTIILSGENDWLSPYIGRMAKIVKLNPADNDRHLKGKTGVIVSKYHMEFDFKKDFTYVILHGATIRVYSRFESAVIRFLKRQNKKEE